MDWGWVMIYALGIFGAGGIAGGIVAYRGSSRTGIRSIAAASIAAGVMMWMVVLMVVPTSTNSTGPGLPVIVGSEIAAETPAK